MSGGRVIPACLICGAEMIPRHCKWECGNCGYRIDCSDRGIEPDWRFEPGESESRTRAND